MKTVVSVIRASILDTFKSFLQEIKENMSSNTTVKAGNNSAHPLKEWKYYHPADLTSAFKIYCKDWKFCKNCKCRATAQEGISS